MPQNSARSRNPEWPADPKTLFDRLVNHLTHRFPGEDVEDAVAGAVWVVAIMRPECPEAYAMTVARNRLANLRRSSARVRRVLPVDQAAPLGAWSDLRGQVYRAMTKLLTAEERDVMMLTARGLSKAQVQSATGLSLRTVYRRYERAVEKLKEALGELSG